MGSFWEEGLATEHQGSLKLSKKGERVLTLPDDGQASMRPGGDYAQNSMESTCKWL